jgi:hypothetical protein
MSTENRHTEAEERDSIQNLAARIAQVEDQLAYHVRTLLRKMGSTGRVGGDHVIERLSEQDVRQRLHDFERAHEAATGEYLDSAEFYDRFCTGEFDNTFGARWATCFEAIQLRAGQDIFGMRGPQRQSAV